MEKGYPKVVWLFVFVCVQKNKDSRSQSSHAPPLPGRPPGLAASRPAREHTHRARGVRPGGPRGPRAAGPFPFSLRSPFLSRFPSGKTWPRKTALWGERALTLPNWAN